MRRNFLKGTAALGALALLGQTRTARAAEPITMWHIFGAETEPGLKNIKRWNDTQPQQIDGKFIPFSQLSQQLIRGVATGDVPDLITIDNPYVASFATQDVLEDLTNDVRASKVIKADQYYTGSWGTTLWGGKQYAVPGEANTLALYYNADMFKAKGLDPNNPPRTWAELQHAAAVLTDKDRGVFGTAFCANQTEEGTFQFLPFLQQSGATLKTLTSPDAAAALQLWTDFVTKGQASRDVLVKRQFEMTSTWLAGGSAMVISGPWELQRMQQVRFDWRVATLPHRGDGHDLQASALGGYVWGISKGATHRDAAFRVIEFMSEPAQMQQSWSGGRLAPVKTLTIEHPTLPQAYSTFTEQMQFAKPRGPHPQWPDISAALQTAIQEALIGRSTPELALQKASRVITPILDRTPMVGL
jgi:multiple sugar transport system substrate-binding protein